MDKGMTKKDIEDNIKKIKENPFVMNNEKWTRKKDGGWSYETLKPEEKPEKQPEKLAKQPEKLAKQPEKQEKKMSDKGQMVKITGLWKNEDKDGNPYFSGYMGGAKILIFKNKYKEKDNQPDYNMYVTPKQERQENTGEDENL